MKTPTAASARGHRHLAVCLDFPLLCCFLAFVFYFSKFALRATTQPHCSLFFYCFHCSHCSGRAEAGFFVIVLLVLFHCLFFFFVCVCVCGWCLGVFCFVFTVGVKRVMLFSSAPRSPLLLLGHYASPPFCFFFSPNESALIFASCLFCRCVSVGVRVRVGVLGWQRTKLYPPQKWCPISHPITSAFFW
jgi:hypothetical protein